MKNHLPDSTQLGQFSAAAEERFELSVDSNNCVRLHSSAPKSPASAYVGKPHGLFGCDDSDNDDSSAPWRFEAICEVIGFVEEENPLVLKPNHKATKNMKTMSSKKDLPDNVCTNLEEEGRLSVSVDSKCCIRLETHSAAPKDGKPRGFLSVDDGESKDEWEPKVEKIMGFIEEDFPNSPSMIEKSSSKYATSSKKSKVVKKTESKTERTAKVNQFATLSTILQIMMDPDTDDGILEAFLGMHTVMLSTRDLLVLLREYVRQLNPATVRVFATYVMVCSADVVRRGSLAMDIIKIIETKNLAVTPEEKRNLNAIKLKLLKQAQKNKSSPSLSLVASVPSNSKFSKKIANSLDDLTPKEMATLLTLEDYTRYTAIMFEDLLNAAKKPSRTISDFIEPSNKLSFWCATLILSKRDINARAECITKLIDVMADLLALQNMNSFMVINAALNMACISRLKATWELMPKKAIAAFEAMQSWADTSTNYRQYRTLLSTTDKPAIPFMGICLRDYVFTTEGSEMKIPRSETTVDDEILDAEESSSHANSASQSSSFVSDGLFSNPSSPSSNVLTYTQLSFSDSSPKLSHQFFGSSRSSLAMRIDTPWSGNLGDAWSKAWSFGGSRKSEEYSRKNSSSASSINNSPQLNRRPSDSISLGVSLDDDDSLFNISQILQVWDVLRPFRKFMYLQYDIPAMMADMPILSPEAKEELKTIPFKDEDELYEISIELEKRKTVISGDDLLLDCTDAGASRQ
eukprot:CAMPEP_0177632340 /NCGR_PEP_ID=MMETSP0447-20121125/2236_1 /TAXON_ID=0 /ORGANISM="Stygamoeba regulata, Strain BSH-02190019" /LENGTH=745 /DNA_ID=CAMNT_0019133895 /DNA_START=120 /DNA_END=2357 /DNA_ORIENTATION=-